MKKEKKEKNPWLNARGFMNDREKMFLSSRFGWMVMAIISLLIALGSVGGTLYVAQQSKFVPYVVQVDKLGQAMAVHRADRAAPVEPAVIHSTIAAWISDARMVTPDIAVQRDAIFRVYSHMTSNDPAIHKMNIWMNGTSESTPFKRSEKVTVSTEIISCIAQSPETWQVDWTENTFDREGNQIGRDRMRALVTVYIIPPTSETTEDQIRKNPLGIYVKDFNWAKQAGF